MRSDGIYRGLFDFREHLSGCNQVTYRQVYSPSLTNAQISLCRKVWLSSGWLLRLLRFGFYGLCNILRFKVYL